MHVYIFYGQDRCYFIIIIILRFYKQDKKYQKYILQVFDFIVFLFTGVVYVAIDNKENSKVAIKDIDISKQTKTELILN